MSELKKQVGGGHYKDMAIQPMEYNVKNKMPWLEGEVIKYVSRWKFKGGVQDLKKAAHLLAYLIEVEELGLEAFVEQLVASSPQAPVEAKEPDLARARRLQHEVVQRDQEMQEAEQEKLTEQQEEINRAVQEPRKGSLPNPPFGGEIDPTSSPKRHSVWRRVGGTSRVVNGLTREERFPGMASYAEARKVASGFPDDVG